MASIKYLELHYHLFLPLCTFVIVCIRECYCGWRWVYWIGLFIILTTGNHMPTCRTGNLRSWKCQSNSTPACILCFGKMPISSLQIHMLHCSIQLFCSNLLQLSWPEIQWLVQYIPRNMHTVVLCCGYTLTDFPISIRLTSLALWQI